jgi:AsmA protein
MRRILKYLFAFVVLVVIAATAAVFLIPREQIVALAADQVREATGRELTLSGDLSPSFWPVLGVRTGPVRLSNAEWGEAADMVSAGAAEIGVELMPLLSGEVKVTTLRLVDPVVALEIDRDGRENWVFKEPAGRETSQAASGSEARELPKISLPEAVITNGLISFTDARSGQRIELSALDLTAGLASIDSPLTLKGSGIWNGERAEFEAFIDTPAAAMEGGKATARIALNSKPASLAFDGDLQAPAGAALPLVNGKVSADVPNPTKALAWATGGGAPAGLADVGAVKLDGTVSATDAALDLAARGSAGYKGRTVSFDLKADGGAGWLDRQAFTVAASARSEGMFEASFSGPVAAGDRPSAEGPLTLRIADLRALAQWAGGAALDAPAGTLESASLDARLAMSGGDRIALSGLDLTLDQTRMTGDAGVDLGGARPMVTARLESGPIDLSPFMAPGGGGGGSGSGGAGGGWSTEPLDLSALRAVDADVAIRAEAVDLGEIKIGRSDIAATLRNGRLDMTISRVDAYGGGISGTLALIAGEEAQLSTDMTVSAVQLRPLLNAVAGFDSLEGLGNFRIRLDGRGRSMDALMKSLDGQGALDLSDGAILGLNLAELVRNFTGQAGGAQKTDFSSVTGSFDVTNGVLHNTDFSFLGPLIRVIGAGTVDIGHQAQNFRLEPTAVASLAGQGGALNESGLGIFPILVTGTWSNPKFAPDLTAAIQGLLTDPNATLDVVTGLVKGADAGAAAGALLGAVTGTGGGSGGSTGQPADPLGQVVGGILGQGASKETGAATAGASQEKPASTLDQALGGLLGGGSSRQTGSAPAGDTGTGSGGGLLGALTGGKKKPPAEPQPAAPVPSAQPAGEAPAIEGATELAPAFAPLPRPATAEGRRLAAIRLAAPAETEPQADQQQEQEQQQEQQQTLPQQQEQPVQQEQPAQPVESQPQEVEQSSQQEEPQPQKKKGLLQQLQTQPQQEQQPAQQAEGQPQQQQQPAQEESNQTQEQDKLPAAEPKNDGKKGVNKILKGLLK